MKKLTTLLGLTFLLLSSVLRAQDLSPKLTHIMSPEEELRKGEIGRSFTPTDPPAPPVRIVAEFEEMQSVLIRYPFGIPMTLIADMSEDCKVKTIVANSSEQAAQSIGCSGRHSPPRCRRRGRCRAKTAAGCSCSTVDSRECHSRN